MFTGIIEEIGKIAKISKGQIYRIEIQSNLEISNGDSIAIQGTCLTVTNRFKKGFSVEAMRQTKRVTTLSAWTAGNDVNLERALRIGDRIGGHIILGHVDEAAELIRIKGNEYFFQINPNNTKYLIPKGSIAINGVSLTISNISKNIVSISLIPFTLEKTTLGRLKNGSFANIEYDYLAKLLNPPKL
jgi:riboflavin synthase